MRCDELHAPTPRSALPRLQPDRFTENIVNILFFVFVLNMTRYNMYNQRKELTLQKIDHEDNRFYSNKKRQQRHSRQEYSAIGRQAIGMLDYRYAVAVIRY